MTAEEKAAKAEQVLEERAAVHAEELESLAATKAADLESLAADVAERLKRVEQYPRLNEVMLFGWTRWTWIKAAYISFILFGALLLWVRC